MKLLLEPNVILRPTSKTIWDQASQFLDPDLVAEYRNGGCPIQNSVYLKELRDQIGLQYDEADDQVELTEEEQKLFDDF